MPRQRIQHRRDTLDIPDDFPERLKLLKEESGLTWSEIARRRETYGNNVWRWKEGLARPNKHHRRALLELADDLGLAHLLTA